MVDAKSSAVLWANAPLVGECEWVSNDNRRILERAAECGNVEALIKLAVAYLYDEGGEFVDGIILYSWCIARYLLLLNVCVG